MPKVNRPTIIYWLFDIRPETLILRPNGRPFYCGKTTQTEKQRLNGHKKEALRRPAREHSKRLLECGYHVDIRAIETVPPGRCWISRERHWIAHLRSYFPGGTNIADGGQGSSGRPPTGLESYMFRIPPEMIIRIDQIIRLKGHKDRSEYVREALAAQIAEDEKNLGID